MPNSIHGELDAKGIRFGIILTRFNHLVGNRLLEGALDCLERHGADLAQVDVIRVPGSFEAPAAAQKLAKQGGYDALVCLGALIRGETAHFDVLTHEVCRGLSEVSRTTGVPIAFGILTADSLDQALERAGGKMGNRGAEAALSAIEMANLFRQLRGKA
jgi:6,7-dimethyl-8-ribityllumazine synthase